MQHRSFALRPASAIKFILRKIARHQGQLFRRVLCRYRRIVRSRPLYQKETHKKEQQMSWRWKRCAWKWQQRGTTIGPARLHPPGEQRYRAQSHPPQLVSNHRATNSAIRTSATPTSWWMAACAYTCEALFNSHHRLIIYMLSGEYINVNIYWTSYGVASIYRRLPGVVLSTNLG